MMQKEEVVAANMRRKSKRYILNHPYAITQGADGKYYLVYAEGESQEGWTPQNGNTSTRAYFGPDVCKFIRNWSTAGPSHHASLTIGHIGDAIEKFGKLKKMDVVKVTADSVVKVVSSD